MADQRKCYAGDLSSDSLGKTVVYTLNTPTKDERSILVHEVKHYFQPIGAGSKRVTVIGGTRDSGAVVQRLDSDHVVEVRS